jgi:hypothetical protein
MEGWDQLYGVLVVWVLPIVVTGATWLREIPIDKLTCADRPVGGWKRPRAWATLGGPVASGGGVVWLAAAVLGSGHGLGRRDEAIRR